MRYQAFTLSLVAGLYANSLAAFHLKSITSNKVNPPIVGWSSWNTYRVNSNETLIKKQADAMVKKDLKGVPDHIHALKFKAGIY